MLSVAASPRPGLRRALVLWLYAVGAGHLLAGLLLTWAGHSGLFNDYLAGIEQAFWGAAAPAPAGPSRSGGWGCSAPPCKAIRCSCWGWCTWATACGPLPPGPG